VSTSGARAGCGSGVISTAGAAPSRAIAGASWAAIAFFESLSMR
jgi:hypothetical protein